MPGPARNAAKPNSRAHRPGPTSRALVMLPAEGCTLPVPKIPAGREWTKEERALWRNLWTSPQATQWDDSFIPAVAAYVTYAFRIYADDASAWTAQEFRHLGAQLGLTPQGMAALGWAVEA